MDRLIESARLKCGRKLQYDDKAAAKAAAKQVWKDRKKRMTPYECPICGGWHLTSHGHEASIEISRVIRERLA